jgi:hypothetical protein
MPIEIVPEYKLSSDVRKLATQLLVASFPDYPRDRSYYKLLPQFLYLVWEGENLIAQMGVEHRVITNTGIPGLCHSTLCICD